jgi:hypothetical protein
MSKDKRFAIIIGTNNYENKKLNYSIKDGSCMSNLCFVSLRSMGRVNMLKSDFEGFKTHQYCDNPACQSFGLVGAGNLTTHSVVQGQVRCKTCKGKPFSVRKGTMFFDCRTPITRIVTCLSQLASGSGVNVVCRNEHVDGTTLRSWIVLAAAQVNTFTAYMQRDMSLSEVQIDEFWSYIKKKTTT